MAEKDKQEKDRCRDCSGELVDEEDYVFYRRLRRAVAYVPVGAVICGIWAPIFCLVRMLIESGIPFLKTPIFLGYIWGYKPYI